MGSVESNNRNSGITQTLSSATYQPPDYRVGELEVVSKSIEFVDSKITVHPSQLKLTEDGEGRGLSAQGQYLYLDKGKPDELGDERLYFRGIPVPEVATYFGKFDNQRGVAYDKHRRTGILNRLIQDSGVLHHLVAGERDVALASIKRHLFQLKWTIRIGGTIAVVLGLLCIFGSIAKFLFRIPIIGSVAQWGAFVLAVAIGIPLSLLAIAGSFLVSNPLILLALFLLAGGIIGYLVWKRGQQRFTQRSLRAGLEQELGEEVDEDRIKQLEFMELARLAQSDGQLDDTEVDYLSAWSKKQGWDQETYSRLIEEARASQREEPSPTKVHLQNLVRVALADGNLRAYEVRTIRLAAQRVGYSNREVNELMDRVSESAELRAGLLKGA